MTPAQDTPAGDPRLHEVAVAVALRTGLLKRCPAHGEVYDAGQHDYQGACMVAGYLVNRGDPLVAPFRGNRVPLTDMLKTLCREYGPACPRCTAAAGGDPAAGPGERRPVSWVVYRVTLKGNVAGPDAVCEEAEWEELARLHPGAHVLIQSGIASEGEAERLARGTSGDPVPRATRTPSVSPASETTRA